MVDCNCQRTGNPMLSIKVPVPLTLHRLLDPSPCFSENAVSEMLPMRSLLNQLNRLLVVIIVVREVSKMVLAPLLTLPSPGSTEH